MALRTVLDGHRTSCSDRSTAKRVTSSKGIGSATGDPLVLPAACPTPRDHRAKSSGKVQGPLETRALKERSASQEHFIDLCHLLDEPTPAEADPSGDTYCFERGARKDTGGDGWADVWKRHHFAWEYKGQRADLDAAFGQLRQYSLAAHRLRFGHNFESQAHMPLRDSSLVEVDSFLEPVPTPK